FLVGRGFIEARTAAFAGAEEGDVDLMLPLSAAESKLRRALLPALMKRVEYNLYRGTRDVRLFEIGTVFASGDSVPQESTRIAIIFTGRRTPPHWSSESPEMDVWDLKGLIEDLASRLGIADTQVASGIEDS